MTDRNIILSLAALLEDSCELDIGITIFGLCLDEFPTFCIGMSAYVCSGALFNGDGRGRIG